MSVLGRYLSIRFSLYVGLILLALVFLALTFELLEKGDQVLQGTGEGSAALAFFALLRMPEMIIQMLPFACLLGALILILVLARHSELIAIWGSGMSAFGMLAALAPVTLGLGALNLVIEDRLVPASIDRLRTWEVGNHKLSDTDADQSAVWVVSEPDIVRIPRAAGISGALEDVVIFRRESDGSLIERLHAKRAEADDAGWQLLDVEIVSATTAEISHKDRMHWSGRIDIANLPLLSREYRELTLPQMYEIIINKGFGQRPVYLAWTWFFYRVSGFLTPILLVGLVVSLVQRRDRAGSSSKVLLLSLAIGFVYFVLDQASLAMGESGLIPPWFAAFSIKAAMISLVGALLVHGE